MKRAVAASLIFGLFLSAGCASWQGQIAYPNTRFAALPKLEPAAIPKSTQGKASLTTGKDDLAADPGEGSFVPVLGQVVFGSDALHLNLTHRKFFYWQDPSRFITVQPAFTAGTWDKNVTGIVSQGSAKLSKSVGIKLSAGDKGVPLGNDKAITLKLGVDSTLKLENVRIARLNLANLDYARALADAASEKDAYFVGEVIVCDVNAQDLVGFNLAYADPVKPGFNPALKADYESNYSGVGLILGASFNKLSVAGNVSFKELGLVKEISRTETLASLTSLPDAFQRRVATLKTNLHALGISKPDIVLASPFTTKGDASGNVVVMPINPFNGGSEVLVVDKTKQADGKAMLSEPGQYQIQYSVVSGNKLYALRTTVELTQKSEQEKAVMENIANREVTYLKWEAVDPGSVK